MILPWGMDKRDKAPEPLKVGDVVPLTRKPLSLRPAFTGPGKPSFKPSRNGKKR